jgi:hypothetical protein
VVNGVIKQVEKAGDGWRWLEMAGDVLDGMTDGCFGYGWTTEGRIKVHHGNLTKR